MARLRDPDDRLRAPADASSRAPSRSAARLWASREQILGGPPAALIVVPIVAAGAAVRHVAKANTVKVTLTDDGCPAKLETPAGATTFTVTNKGDGAVSEFEVLTKSRIIGEVENIAPGLSGEFSLTLKPGDYTTKCPGGDKHATGALTVTGTADTKLTPAQQAVVDTYRGYLEAQTAELVTATNAFVAAVQSGNVELAKQLYGPRASRTSASSRWRRRSATSTRRSTPARVTSATTNGAGSTRSSRRCS